MNAEPLVRSVVPAEGTRRSALVLAAPQPVLRALLRVLVRLPSRSRLRRRLLIDTVLAGFDLLNRREIDRLLRFYDPRCEIRLGPGWPLDLDPVQHGHAGARAIISAWDEAGEVSFVPNEILDMGGPAFVVLASVRMTGGASGVNPRPLSAVWSYTVEAGLIAVQALRNDGWDTGPAELAEALRRVPKESRHAHASTPADAVVTRVPRGRPPRVTRNLHERLMVRFPAWRTLAALGVRLFSPRSRVRRAMLCREIVSGWRATSRRDFELVMVRYAHDAELEFDPGFGAVGLAGPFRGREGILEREQAFQREWQRFEAVPETVIDLGNRVVVLGTAQVTGRTSGIEMETEVAQVLTLRRGLAVRDQIFLSWNEGLRAAGLEPDAVLLPSSRMAAQSTSTDG